MNIDWSHALATYGALAVLLGTFLEGESILVAGAIAARQGYLPLHQVLLAALAGSFLGDQLYFFMGRSWGRAWLAPRPKMRARVHRVHRLLARHDALFILGFRFLYGLRTVSPFVLGTSDVLVARFVPLNFCGALIWSLTVGGLGFVLGDIPVRALVGQAIARGWGPPLAAATALLVVAVVWRVARRPAAPLAAAPEGGGDADSEAVPHARPERQDLPPKGPRISAQ